MSESDSKLLIKKVETVDNFEEEKEKSCKEANYDCNNCYYYCHCKNVNDEFHCMYDCEAIACPLI